MRRLPALLLVLLVAGAVGYIQAVPIGGVKLTLVDSNGKPLTDYGKIYYTVWTFNEKGSIKILQRGTIEKKFLFSGDTIRISAAELDKAKDIARKIHSKTAFIGIDVWVERNGKVYTLPPGSFESTLERTILPRNMEIKMNLKEARVTDIRRIEGSKIGTGKQGKVAPLVSGHWYEWRTVPGEDNSYSNVEIPVLIIHNNVWSDIFGSVDIAAETQKYWGPDVTVAFGDQISKKISFDPDSITVKVLGRSITNYYAGGDDITVPKTYSWGYVWIKGTVHYIYQKEYSCYTGLGCFETGNERYFAKIDSFTITETHGNVKDIESGSTLGRPPYNFPSEWMKKSEGITKNIGNPVYISDFYGHIYAGTDGHSFGVGIPIGAVLQGVTEHALPRWFDTITVGFSTGDYSSYVMLGHLKNRGPEDQVTFYAMESNYKVRIPIHHWYGTTYEDVNVPIGLYVEANSS
ncbi:hypothetical protein JCM16138_02840 [Thermococcus atlanticus]